MAVSQLHSMSLQKEVKSNQKQLSYKKKLCSLCCEKDVKSKAVAKKNYIMAKN